MKRLTDSASNLVGSYNAQVRHHTPIRWLCSHARFYLNLSRNGPHRSWNDVGYSSWSILGWYRWNSNRLSTYDTRSRKRYVLAVSGSSAHCPTNGSNWTETNGNNSCSRTSIRVSADFFPGSVWRSPGWKLHANLKWADFNLDRAARSRSAQFCLFEFDGVYWNL